MVLLRFSWAEQNIIRKSEPLASILYLKTYNLKNGVKGKFVPLEVEEDEDYDADRSMGFEDLAFLGHNKYLNLSNIDFNWIVDEQIEKEILKHRDVGGRFSIKNVGPKPAVKHGDGLGRFNDDDDDLEPNNDDEGQCSENYAISHIRPRIPFSAYPKSKY